MLFNPYTSQENKDTGASEGPYASTAFQKTRRTSQAGLMLLPFYFGVAGLLVGCQSIERYFATINVAGGLDSSSVTFYTRKSDLERKYSNDSAAEITRRIHSENSSIERAFYAISSAPDPLPFLGNEGFFRYMRTSLTFNSPRTYRGTLVNYPDDGRSTGNPQLALFYQLYPLPDLLGRRMEFIYEEYRAYFTLYFPYYEASNWYLAFGQSYGQSRYNFDLLEQNFRLASVVREWTPVYMVSLNYGYRLGRFYPKGLLSNTYLFLEVAADASPIHPINVNIPRTDGLPGKRLYASMNYARIGIRKTISLTDRPVDSYENRSRNEDDTGPEAIEEKRDESNPKRDDEENRTEDSRRRDNIEAAPGTQHNGKDSDEDEPGKNRSREGDSADPDHSYFPY